MNAATAIPGRRVETDRFPARPERSRSRTSPTLAAAMTDLRGYIRRQPDVTLGELRAAFLGTGFTWGSDGKLAYSPARMALIAEFDELIELYGWDASGAELFL